MVNVEIFQKNRTETVLEDLLVFLEKRHRVLGNVRPCPILHKASFTLVHEQLGGQHVVSLPGSRLDFIKHGLKNLISMRNTISLWIHDCDPWIIFLFRDDSFHSGVG